MDALAICAALNSIPDSASSAFSGGLVALWEGPWVGFERTGWA